MILVACPICGKERWLSSYSAKKTGGRCQPCYHAIEGKKRKGRPTGLTGELSPTWKGGRLIDKDGYIQVYLRPDDFFYPLAKGNRYVYEHRLVMAKHLNRHLLSWEIVHHKNGNKQDNRLENLQLLPGSKQHLPSMLLQSKVTQLEKKVFQLSQRVLILEAENIILRTPCNIGKEV